MRKVCRVGGYVVVGPAGRSDGSLWIERDGKPFVVIQEGTEVDVFSNRHDQGGARPVLTLHDRDGDGSFDFLSYETRDGHGDPAGEVTDGDLDGEADFKVLPAVQGFGLHHRSVSSWGGLALASRLEVGRLSFQEAAMTVSDVGREGVRLVSQLTGVAISVPVVAGFVLLGAAVLVGGSLLDVGRKLLETKSRAQEPLKAA